MYVPVHSFRAHRESTPTCRNHTINIATVVSDCALRRERYMLLQEPKASTPLHFFVTKQLAGNERKHNHPSYIQEPSRYTFPFSYHHRERIYSALLREQIEVQYLALIMSTTDTEESHYETQEEGGLPSTIDAPVESSISPPSMNNNLPPCKVILDMQMMHTIESTDSGTGETPQIEQDRISVEGVSTTSSLISKELISAGLSFFTATATVFNMSGASLYVPWAFAQGGTLLTSIVLGAAILQAYISASFLLDASARAQALDLLTTDGSLPRQYTLKIRERKYELSLLTKIFLGKSGSFFFSLTTLVSL
jgi:hypothetical protein